MGDEVESTTGGVFEDPLATRINAKYREVESLARSTVEGGIELGGMLLEKKESMRHGEWGPWVRAHFEGSERQAERFMQVYNNRDKLRANPTRVADMSLRQALRIISPPPKEDQKEDSTKKLAKQLKDKGVSPKLAKWLAQSATSTREEPGQDAITRERVEGPLRGASDHGAVHSLPQDLSEEMTFDHWSGEERALLDAFRAGESIVVNMHKNGPHRNLVPWLRATDQLTVADRTTDWGNPFELDVDGDRATVVRLYAEHYLPYKRRLKEQLSEMEGPTAWGCWCAPQPCHCDELLRIAEGEAR
jgi:hypothetical protein